MTIIAPVAITPAGLPLPDPADRATFSARKLEQLRWANNEYATGSKALADAGYANALDAKANADAVAANAATVAANTANVAALSDFKGTWASQTGALNKPASVSHNGAFWALLSNLADVTTSQPGVTADWAVVGGAFPVVPISSNTTAVPWRTYLITAACTLTLPASPANGAQVCIVVLPGVAGVVISPGAEKIRNATGSMNVDVASFSQTLTNSGAAYGWV